MGTKKERRIAGASGLHPPTISRQPENYVLAIKTMSRPNTKNELIRIRVTDKQKELATINVKKMNMSQYIRCCILADYPGLIRRLPESIATNNLLNKIYHRLEGHTDSETLEYIRNAVADYYGMEKGGMENV